MYIGETKKAKEERQQDIYSDRLEKREHKNLLTDQY
jgi:hypothetical protein